MSALPDNIVPFTLPKKPRIKEKDAPPDQRKVCVLPIRAVFDQKLTHGALQVLAALCSYCNRAGITWVSQTRLAKELGISQQAVAKQFKQLREHGYIETVRKGFKGERTDTLRVIFDPAITAEEAIAMTSNKEDTRPPAIREEQEKAMQADPEGQKRIAQMIAKALKQPAKPRSYTMPKSGDTKAVKEIKEANARALARRSKTVDKRVDNPSPNHNPEVVNEEALQSQPNHNLEVVQNTKGIPIDKVKDKDKGNHKVISNHKVQYNRELLIDAGMTDAQVDDALGHLLPLFRAEGIEPTEQVLTDAVLQMHRDTATPHSV